ncbi:alpha/beta hydrolase [Smaragdicoccus niigatensis]|uniref:alpha/beta hydrolase n=1 Tax=Smaragdicoccus niigatensis TaxID=359359 RepID=UPI0006862B54|nr:alpha/beta hydrolase [Smaragdicoccus niigatensis]
MSRQPDMQFFAGRSLASRLTALPFRVVRAVANRYPISAGSMALVDSAAKWVGSRNVAGTVLEVDADGVRALWVSAPNVTTKRRTILHIHGGGFVFGTPEMYLNAAVRLSAATNARVLLFDYRHPPVANVAEMAADCLTVYRWLVRRKSPGRVVVSGDSAGGNLAFGMVAAARDSGLPIPAGLLTFSGWLDPDDRGGEHECDAMWPRHFAAEASEYCYDADGLSALVRPLDMDLTDFPPTLLQAGSTEPLAVSNRHMATKLAQARVPVSLQLWQDQIHVFQLVVGFLPESREALSQIAAFVDDVGLSQPARRLGVV